MLKTIILCEMDNRYQTVYAPSVRARLMSLTGTDGAQYKKADIPASPEKFTQTEIIFSTWGMPTFTEEEIRAYLPALKCVFYAAGSVQGFARPFLNCGVRVFSAWAANAVPVAEYTVSQILLSGKDFFRQTDLICRRRFADAAARRGGHMGNYRRRVGLVGCGMIGSLVAEKLKGFDLDVAVCDPFLSEERAEELGVTVCSLGELFATCSVVSNHLANNKNTQKMLRYEHFFSMPPYGTFINTGRGAQVAEADLARALAERPDLTALLDVTDPEPSPVDHPFYALENCYLTPHIAGSLGGEVVRMAEYMADEYELYAAGKDCRYEVTLKMLETMA